MTGPATGPVQAASLGQPAWMIAATTRQVMAALDAARPGSARFVGGCVRNQLMGYPVDDIDIATQLSPDKVMEALVAAGLRAVPTGLDHGTVTAVCRGRPFEITTLRRDVETDGRRAVVAFTEDWAEDAARRDFRLNALYADADGTVHDPTGGGLDDARHGRVIFIGDADLRLREDYLRILRFFRFNAWYGAQLDKDGLEACRRHAEGLSRIAAERIWKELSRLLAAPDLGATLDAMVAAGVWAAILPAADLRADETEARARLKALRTGEARLGLPADPLRRLMTLLRRDPAAVTEAAARLRLSNAERDRLQAWANPGLDDLRAEEGPSARAGIYRYGVQAVLDRALLDTGSGPSGIAGLYTMAQSWQPPVFPLGGEAAKAAGLKGPDIGAALHAVEDHWVAGDFLADEATLRDALNSWQRSSR